MSGVIISGGFGGLGQAVSKAFEREGHNVALLNRGGSSSHESATPSFGGFDLADPCAGQLAHGAASASLKWTSWAISRAASAFQTSLKAVQSFGR